MADLFGDAPRVLNKHRDGIPPGAVYVGRGSPWGNPYKIGPGWDRAAVIRMFERDVLPGLDLAPLRASTVWYATERSRDDAISAANKPRQWLPVVAMQKVER